MDNLTLKYRISYYRSWSIRSLFVSILKNPFKLFFRSLERLLVLDNLSFEINQGDRLGIIGVNGAGKTSLCRCLAGMILPTTGTVKVEGEVRPLFNTTIGILPELTGRENAEILARLIYPRLNKTELKNLINEALNFSELNEFIEAPFITYSKGMQVRLCLSIISAFSCDLLILDEVFDGADEFFREKIKRRVMSMIEKSGAVVFVSHTAEQIEEVCNRVIVLSGAKIVYDGDVENGLKFYREIKC